MKARAAKNKDTEVWFRSTQVLTNAPCVLSLRPTRCSHTGKAGFLQMFCHSTRPGTVPLDPVPGHRCQGNTGTDPVPPQRCPGAYEVRTDPVPPGSMCEVSTDQEVRVNPYGDRVNALPRYKAGR